MLADAELLRWRRASSQAAVAEKAFLGVALVVVDVLLNQVAVAVLLQRLARADAARPVAPVVVLAPVAAGA